MPERNTTREQWTKIAASFARILTHRGIPFSDACIEMGFPKNQYHRMHRCLKGPSKSRPHTQKIINVIQKWNEDYAEIADKKERIARIAKTAPAKIRRGISLINLRPLTKKEINHAERSNHKKKK